MKAGGPSHGFRRTASLVVIASLLVSVRGARIPFAPHATPAVAAAASTPRTLRQPLVGQPGRMALPDHAIPQAETAPASALSANGTIGLYADNGDTASTSISRSTITGYQGSGSGAGYGVYAYSGSGTFAISSTTFVAGSGAGAGALYGVYLSGDGAGSPSITGSSFSGGTDGMYAASPGALTVTGSTFSGLSQGVVAASPSALTVSDNTFATTS